jgi:hypothetical protein
MFTFASSSPVKDIKDNTKELEALDYEVLPPLYQVDELSIDAFELIMKNQRKNRKVKK